LKELRFEDAPDYGAPGAAFLATVEDVLVEKILRRGNGRGARKVFPC
jgi:hypothetical protein